MPVNPDIASCVDALVEHLDITGQLTDYFINSCQRYRIHPQPDGIQDRILGMKTAIYERLICIVAPLPTTEKRRAVRTRLIDCVLERVKRPRRPQ